MRANRIRLKATKKYKSTTNSNNNLPVTDNLFNRNFVDENLTRSGFQTSLIFMQKKADFTLLGGLWQTV